MLASFNQPTDDWVEGLPLGNGISAAMLYGLPGKLICALNHVDFWRDNLGTIDRDYSSFVRESQQMMLRGDCEQANRNYAENMTMEVMPRNDRPFDSYNGYTNSFQPLGDIVIELDGCDAASDYRRCLDLENGIATTTFRVSDNTIRQECFIPAGEDVIVFKMSATRPVSGKITFVRADQDEYTWTAAAGDEQIAIDGKFDEGVVSALRADATVVGPQASCAKHDSTSLRIENATELTLLITVEAGKGPHDAASLCDEKMRAATGRGFAEIRAAHCKEHSSMFNRVNLDLADGKPRGRTETPALVTEASDGHGANEYFEQVFQMGRYLIMACNRAGRRPANLQGIWNNHFEPEWDADWHLDENIQMNQWLCNPTNLDECNDALFRQMESFVEVGRMLAKNIAGADGILFYTVCGGDGMMWTGQGPMWSGAAAWIAQHFWTHYEFTLDRDFLANHAYPFIKQVGLFYRDFLVKNADGYYVGGVSHSPENAPPNGFGMNIHATMDTALVREVTRHLLAGGRELGIDEELWPLWQDLHDNVLPYPIAETGELKEWPEPFEEQPKHRHFSHLYPLFPGDEFTEELTPDLMKAAAAANRLREEKGLQEYMGWSCSQAACFHARLGNGDNALQHLGGLAKMSFCNLLTAGAGLTWTFNVPRLFQIEAALGASAAVAEMLLQSHRGIVRLLPALPAAWADGCVKGLKARGAFEVDITWQDERVTQAEIASLKGGDCEICCCTKWRTVQITDIASGMDAKHIIDPESGAIQISTTPNSRFRLVFE